MHLSSVIPANDTRESVFGHRNFSRRERESNLGPLAPEASAKPLSYHAFLMVCLRSHLNIRGSPNSCTIGVYWPDNEVLNLY